MQWAKSSRVRCVADAHLAPAAQRLGDQEQVGHAVARVLVVVARRLPRRGGQRRARLAEQLLAGLVQADQRARRVVGPVVDVEHVLHVPDELGVGFGGMHHCSFSHGLSSFFSRSAAPSRARRPPPPPAAPVRRPAAAASSARARPAGRSRRGRPGAPPPRRRACARTPGPGACAPAPPPARRSTYCAADAGDGGRDGPPGPRRSPRRLQPGAALALVGLEQDAGVGQHPGGRLPTPDQRAQLGALGFRQRHGILGLAHAGLLRDWLGSSEPQPTVPAITPQFTRDGPQRTRSSLLILLAHRADRPWTSIVR